VISNNQLLFMTTRVKTHISLISYVSTTGYYSPSSHKPTLLCVEGITTNKRSVLK